MAVDVQIGGGQIWNTSDYSVSEDATPVDVTSTSGGTPQFSLGTNLLEGDKALIGQSLVITDGSQGRTQGTVTGLASQGNLLRITGYTAFTLLNTIVNAAPFSGRLDNALGYYLSLAGLGPGTYQVDASIASRTIAFAGFSGNLQDQIKNICSGQQVELSYVDGQFVMRPLRTNTAQIYRDSEVEFSMDNSGTAQKLNIFYYNAVPMTNQLAYPVSPLNRGDDVQQVSDGQVITVNLRLEPTASDGTGAGVSLASISQPVCVDSVDEDISGWIGTQSVYSIVDSNNNPYPASLWNSNGGLITAIIDPDSSGITLTIKAPVGGLGPYRIAATNDDGQSFYSTLRIVGTGVRYNKQIWSVSTGLTSLNTNTVAPATIDNIAINTIADAMSAGLSSLRSIQGPAQQISVKSKGINTLGVSGEYTLMTFAQWDTLFGGHTFSWWDASWASKSFQNYDDYLFSLVRGKFENQAFGNVGGARVWNDYSWYRISSARLSDSGVEYTALIDNIFSDWDAVWGGKTFSQWDAVWAGKRFADQSPYPLAPSVPNGVKTQYLMSSSVQDFSNLKGLGYQHQPNDPSFRTRASNVPTVIATNLLTNPSFETAGAAATVRTNYVPNPNLETNATGWVGLSSSTVTRDTTVAHSGTASLKVVTPGAVAQEGGGIVVSQSFVSSQVSTGVWVLAPVGVQMISVIRAGSAVNDAITSFTGTGAWQFVTATHAAFSDMTSAQLLVRTATATAVTFWVDDAIMESAGFCLGSFDGSTAASGDFTYAWTGPANASTSVQQGLTVVGTSVPSTTNGGGIQSTQWSKSSSKSLRCLTVQQNYTGFCDIYPITVTPGATYTIVATGWMPAPQTGPGVSLATARAIGARFPQGTESFIGPQLVNDSGEQTLYYTFTVPADRTTMNLRLYQGPYNAVGDVWWDNLMLIAGAYTGPAFNGDTPSGINVVYSWTGAQNASTSTMAVRG